MSPKYMFRNFVENESNMCFVTYTIYFASQIEYPKKTVPDLELDRGFIVKNSYNGIDVFLINLAIPITF